MKLSKTAWNNVIIFSVMGIILLINATNDRLFSSSDNGNDALILPEHSVVLALSIILPNSGSVMFERIGKAWQMTSQGVLVDLNNQQIDQIIRAWQQSSGLVQAGDIVVDGQQGVEAIASLAGIAQDQHFTLYPLADQLLVYNHHKALWLSFPVAISHQLIPVLSDT